MPLPLETQSLNHSTTNEVSRRLLFKLLFSYCCCSHRWFCKIHIELLKNLRVPCVRWSGIWKSCDSFGKHTGQCLRHNHWAWRLPAHHFLKVFLPKAWIYPLQFTLLLKIPAILLSYTYKYIAEMYGVLEKLGQSDWLFARSWSQIPLRDWELVQKAVVWLYRVPSARSHAAAGWNTLKALQKGRGMGTNRKLNRASFWGWKICGRSRSPAVKV